MIADRGVSRDLVCDSTYNLLPFGEISSFILVSPRPMFYFIYFTTESTYSGLYILCISNFPDSSRFFK